MASLWNLKAQATFGAFHRRQTIGFPGERAKRQIHRIPRENFGL
jgi:hypothetical protein